MVRGCGSTVSTVGEELGKERPRTNDVSVAFPEAKKKKNTAECV